MFALTTPDLENSLLGFVIISAAPNNNWLHGLDKRAQEYCMPDISYDQQVYEADKNNENLKKFVIACWRYYMLESSEKEALRIFESLSYNHKAYDWAQKNFTPNFKASWVPQKLALKLIRYII